MSEPSLQEMGRLADAAFRKAMVDVHRQALLTNTPIIVQEGDTVLEIQPSLELLRELEADDGPAPQLTEEFRQPLKTRGDEASPSPKQRSTRNPGN
jgi:hypothetical protein